MNLLFLHNNNYYMYVLRQNHTLHMLQRDLYNTCKWKRNMSRTLFIYSWQSHTHTHVGGGCHSNCLHEMATFMKINVHA